MMWVVFAAMAALAAALLVLPAGRRTAVDGTRDSADRAVYRDQLREIDRDLERGRIAPEEAEAARTEIKRRLLAAADRIEPAGSGSSAARRAAAMVALAVPLAALALYAAIGRPDAPAELARWDAGRAESDRAIADLRDAAEDAPRDPAAWGRLGLGLMRAGRPGEAAEALARAVDLTGNQPDLLAAWGEALALAAGGEVTAEARAALDRALAVDPGNLRARFYLALARFQEGAVREALDTWLALERESPPDAPWRPVLDVRIRGAAEELGIDVADLDRGTAPPVDPGAVADMSEADRQAMIEGMVAGLAQRLEAEPDDLEGWLRLARSYEVLGRMAAARDAMARASALAPERADLLMQLGRLTYEAAGTPETVPDDVADIMRRVLAMDPDNALALWFVGVAAADSGRPAEAREHWQRLLARLEPGTPQHAELQSRIDALPPEAAPDAAR